MSCNKSLPHSSIVSNVSCLYSEVGDCCHAQEMYEHKDTLMHEPTNSCMFGQAFNRSMLHVLGLFCQEFTPLTLQNIRGFIYQSKQQKENEKCNRFQIILFSFG